MPLRENKKKYFRQHTSPIPQKLPTPHLPDTISAMSTIRAFIAVNLPPAVKEALDQVSQTLAQQMPPRVVRWVKPDRMHLTLRFLGDTAVASLPTLATALDQLTPQHAPFNLHLATLGCFPNRKRPRVIWVGLQGDTTPLHTLKQALDQTLIPHGWQPEEKPFKAHLTIGRIKDSRLLRNSQWQANIPHLIVPVTAVHLIQSQLRPSGPIYTIRHTTHLKPTA